MKNLGRALKAGVKGFANAFGPARYHAGGVQVRCTHCKGELFQEQEAVSVEPFQEIALELGALWMETAED